MGNLKHWKHNVKNGLFENEVISNAVSCSVIEGFCQEARHHWRASFWDPRTTIITFLLQVIDGAKTLRAAVAVLLTHLASRNESDLPSADPAAYCQARIRLPLQIFTRLLGHVAEEMRSLVTEVTGWHGMRVWVADGSNSSMPDTPSLQKAFPQNPGQKPGCGFPQAQFVALFCWATGALVDLAMDTMVPHELSLFRRLWHNFKSGDVVLADRAYCNYVDMTRFLQRGVFVVFRLHQRREHDMRKGKRLGPDDRLMTWYRPKRWLASMGVSKEEFETLPQTLVVCLVRITNVPRGFRSRTIYVATTLIDPVEFPADDLRELYRDRWTAELNLRNIKTDMAMEVLRGQSPDVVRKEIAMHLLAYNLIRLLMWKAAQQHGRDLHRLSFTGTLHRLRAALPLFLIQLVRSGVDSRVLLEQLLEWIANDRVPHRPHRLEPRCLKRRRKNYSMLTKSRSQYKEAKGHKAAHAS